MTTPVSFELAKLLKEKGFNKPTNLLYQLNGTLHTVIPNSDYPHLKVHNNKEIDSYTNGFLNWNGLDLDEDERLDLYSGFNERYEDAFSVCCTTPTIVDVIMWLYEKHGIWIFLLPQDKSCVDFRIDDSEYPSLPLFFFILRYGKDLSVIECLNSSDPNGDLFIHFDNPTEAYEAAILYTLKNLIP